MSEKENRCVLALGFFDGVHIGHAALMRQTVARAAELGCQSAVMTFDTHPDSLVLGKNVPLINSAPDRAWLIRKYFGIQRVEFFRFTRETMQTPWREFLQEIRDDLGAVHFVVGHDFRFGYRGEGNAELLKDYCAENGLGCDVIAAVKLDDITVSSTYIRTLIAAGDMPAAERFLGHPHILTDVVHQGKRLGRRIGAPTVNMQFAPGVLVPRHGVYAARVRLPEGVFAAVTNIGVRPTVDNTDQISVESHLLDFEGNLYGRHMILEFVEHIRDEIRFDSLEELSAQIARDSQRAGEILEGRL